MRSPPRFFLDTQVTIIYDLAVKKQVALKQQAALARNHLPTRIAKLLVNHSSEELAFRIGVSVSTIYRWRKGSARTSRGVLRSIEALEHDDEQVALAQEARKLLDENENAHPDVVRHWK